MQRSPQAPGGWERRLLSRAAEKATPKKKPRLRGAHHLLPMTRCIAVSSGRAQAKIVAKNRLVAHRRVASSRALYQPGWNVGVLLPGRTSRPACAFTRLHPFRTASKWCGRRYPCPRRCSEFLTFFSSVRPVWTCQQALSFNTQASPVPVYGCRMKTGTCDKRVGMRWTKVYRPSTFLSCRLLTTFTLRAAPRSARRTFPAGLRHSHDLRGTRQSI
jgi:hypothetical protein